MDMGLFREIYKRKRFLSENVRALCYINRCCVSLSPIWVQEPKHSFTHLAVENVGWPRLALMLYQLMITCTFQCVKFHQIFNVDVGISLDLKSVWDLYLKSLVFKADKYLKSNTVL